jgi:hypothetical protein
MFFKCRSICSKGLAGGNNFVARLQVQGTAYDPSQVQDLQVVFTLNAGSETDMFRRLGRYMYITANLFTDGEPWKC